MSVFTEIEKQNGESNMAENIATYVLKVYLSKVKKNNVTVSI